MTDNNLILWELQNITKELTKTKDENTLNLRMKRPTENFHFNEPILNNSKLGLIKLSVYNSVFYIIEINGNFIYASKTCSELTFIRILLELSYGCLKNMVYS